MNSLNTTIPVFFSCDDRYLPFLAVSIRSLVDNLSEHSQCHIHILNNGLDTERVQKVLDMANDHVEISLVNVSKQIEPLAEKLNLRDYYTVSIYFRLFIASLFPQYHKAIYLDADIAVNGDITKLYETPLGDLLVGAVSDDIIASHPDFIRYAEVGVGVPYRKYFNSGMMLMNLDQFRAQEIERKFVELLNRYHFETVCPDQDYLNVLCRDQVFYLNKGWNKMSINNDYDGVPDIVHYNSFFKPWQYHDICYAEYFWIYAKRTPFYDELLGILENFSWRDRLAHRIATRSLHQSVQKICDSNNNFYRTLCPRKIELPLGEVIYEV